jgi:DNA-directed RNA polymerase I subunit RPA2
VAHASDVDRLKTLSEPHVHSFDYFVEAGLARAVADIEPAELDLVRSASSRNAVAVVESAGDGPQAGPSSVDTMRFWVENVKVSAPTKANHRRRGGTAKLLPRECRELGLLYAGAVTGDFCFQINNTGTGSMGKVVRISKKFGDMPIMVGSTACHLRDKTPLELVACKEEHNEFGGYFIVSGIERCVRLLQIPRRNHAMAIQRSNYKNRGPTYTDLGIAIRCARHCNDCTSVTNTVHYLTTGGASLKFVARKQEFLIPAILIVRALGQGITDEELYNRLIQGDEHNTFLRARAELLLQDARARYGNLNTPTECLAFLGARFRSLSLRADSTSDVDVGHYMIRRYVDLEKKVETTLQNSQTTFIRFLFIRAHISDCLKCCDLLCCISHFLLM